MKLIKRTVALLLAVLLLTVAACSGGGEGAPVKDTPNETGEDGKGAESPLLWRATDEQGRVIWFFGTIHMGDKRSDQVIKRLGSVLEQCDALAVEFDAVAYAKDLKSQQRDLVQLVYTDGTNIRDHIPADLYNKLTDLLKGENLYLKIYDQYKPAMWYQLFNQAMISKTELSSNKAIDTLLIKNANLAGREVLEVESAQFQYDMLANTPDDYYILAMSNDIEAEDELTDSLNELYEVWLKGDEERLAELLSEADDIEDLSAEEKKLVEDFNKKLVTDRNIGMAGKAKEYVAGGKTVFFAVGAMHFLGEDGIVSLLKNEGFTFERVYI